MSALVAYKLSGQDNDTYMFHRDEFDPCSVCGYRKDFLKYNPNYVPRKSMRDYSATYDGFHIVSANFRNCIEGKFEGVIFEAFSDRKDYFNLRLEKFVEFDYERAKTRFLKKCEHCGNFESVVGTGRPPNLKVASPILNGIFRTDLFFASGNEKHPLVIVGIETRYELESCGLKGLEFSEVHGFGLASIR